MTANNKVREYLYERASQAYEDSKELAQQLNEAPCAKCGESDYIQLYRNVVGEIEGSVQGYFSLFGGSISGYINGSTRTLPVLSCTNCNNEKKVATYDYPSVSDMFWSDMHYLYFGVDQGNVGYLNKFRTEKSFYLDHAYDLHKYLESTYNWSYEFYNSMQHWSPEMFAQLGFKIDKVERKFLWFKWKSYPRWEELAK